MSLLFLQKVLKIISGFYRALIAIHDRAAIFYSFYNDNCAYEIKSIFTETFFFTFLLIGVLIR